MTDSREFNASTVEEALSKASGSLGVSEEEIPYEVLDTGSGGFLGIGARDARIKVSFGVNEDSEALVEPESNEKSPVGTADSDDEQEDPLSSSPASDSVDDEDEHEEKKEVVAAASDDLIEEVRDYVSTVVDAMGLGARVDVYDTEECIAVDIVSDHTALIIGQKGETIDSMQYLVNSAVYRDREFVKRIVLDSEGYRQRRVEAIQGMAHRTARKSIREQRDVKMPPMNSSERRVVHVYLKENPEVTTFSEGSGDDRQVIVSPD